MVAMYEVAGRKVGSHVVRLPMHTLLHISCTANLSLKLAMWTLGLAAVGGYYGMSGGEKKKEQGPPINATSPDEEKFIKCVVGLVT